MIDFPTWFVAGCYGGIACCIFAIATNALYTTLRKRGTTRQLAMVIVLCALAALLLLPAIIWYNMRFSVRQASISYAEIEVMLSYIAVCGWFLPLSATTSYCLYSLPRLSTTALDIPRMHGSTRTKPTAGERRPPRYRPGVPVPFVYREDIPWGWLEYRNGNFQGQRLALKRAIVTIGRDEDNDIWIDDEMASRRHAELAWDEGQIYLTDCDSLNGVLLNGRRIRGYSLVESNDLIEIGSHRFIFILEQSKESPVDESDDPLARLTWRSTADANEAEDDNMPATAAVPETPGAPVTEALHPQLLGKGCDETECDGKATEEMSYPAQLHLEREQGGALIIKSGELSGRAFLLDRSVITVGRGFESDIVINDPSISRQHIRFARRVDGDYVQDLASRNGTRVNNAPLRQYQLLKCGDIICLGNILLEYTSAQAIQTIPLTHIITPHPFTGPISNTGPALLKLPSRHK